MDLTNETISPEVRVASIQTNPRNGDVLFNVNTISRNMAELSEQGVNLLVFPELAVTGFPFHSRNAMSRLAELVPEGQSTQTVLEKSKIHNINCCFGILEKDQHNPNMLYSTAVFAAPNGYVGKYRKNHLWGKEKLFLEPGNLGFPVFTTSIGKIGILISYDVFFPESCRILALQGAQLVLAPNSWMGHSSIAGTEHYPINTIVAMDESHKNRTFMVSSNRVDPGNPHGFSGGSMITGPTGWVIAGPASTKEEESLTANVNLEEACKAKYVSEYNNDFADRREDLYDVTLGYRKDRGVHATNLKQEGVNP